MRGLPPRNLDKSDSQAPSGTQSGESSSHANTLAPEVLLFRRVQSFPQPENPYLWSPLLANAGLSHIEENVGHALCTLVGALNQQNRYQVIVRVDPALGPERSAVAVGTYRMSRQFTQRIGDDFPGEAIIGAAHPSHRLNSGSLRLSHHVYGEGRQVAGALVNAVVEHHAVEVKQVFSGGVEAPSWCGKNGSPSVLRGIATK